MSNGKLPARGYIRHSIDRANLRVTCRVTSRWLEFPDVADELPDGDYMWVSVMTEGADNQPKKICELALSKQDLLGVLSQIRTEPHPRKEVG